MKNNRFYNWLFLLLLTISVSHGAVVQYSHYCFSQQKKYISSQEGTKCESHSQKSTTKSCHKDDTQSSPCCEVELSIFDNDQVVQNVFGFVHQLLFKPLDFPIFQYLVPSQIIRENRIFIPPPQVKSPYFILFQVFRL